MTALWMLAELRPVFEVAAVAGAGAHLASLGGFAGWRLAGGEDGATWSGYSACERCGARLGVVARMPCVGWLRGCRSCGARGSPAWPALEAGSALVVALAWVGGGPRAGLAAGLWVLFSAVVTGSETRARTVPEGAAWVLLWAGLAASFAGGVESRVAGAAAGWAVAASWRWVAVRAARWRRPDEAFGEGDVWLCAVLGAWLGPAGAAWAGILGCGGFGLWAGAAAWRSGTAGAGRWPARAFGPWLLAGGTLVLCWVAAGGRVPGSVWAGAVGLWS